MSDPNTDELKHRLRKLIRARLEQLIPCRLPDVEDVSTPEQRAQGIMAMECWPYGWPYDA